MENKNTTGRELRWAVLGCGWIAGEMAQALAANGRKFAAVCSRTRARSEAFAAAHQIGAVYDDFAQMVRSPQIDAVYIATPHNTHITYILEALRSGKHVLCEKAITLNSRELELASRLARENGLVLAEAMTIYHMPLHRQVKERILSGELGPVRMIQLNFGSYKEYDMENRFFNPKLAGGALLDIGVYALSFARWYMSSKPDSVCSQVKLAPSGVDEQIGFLLSNPQQEMAVLSVTLHAKQPKRGIIACEKGYIEIMDYPRADEAVITWTETGKQQRICAGAQSDALYYEILDMERTVSRQGDFSCLAYTCDVMDIMTQSRREWGLAYPEEE